MSSSAFVSATAVNVPTTTETVVATSPLIPYVNAGNEGNRISGVINITTGASVTAVVIRVRAGVGTGGAVLGVAQTHTIGAAVSGSIPYAAPDPTVNAPAGLQYTVTVQQTAATGAGTVNYGDISVTPCTQFVG